MDSCEADIKPEINEEEILEKDPLFIMKEAADFKNIESFKNTVTPSPSTSISFVNCGEAEVKLDIKK